MPSRYIVRPGIAGAPGDPGPQGSHGVPGRQGRIGDQGVMPYLPGSGALKVRIELDNRIITVIL